MTSFVDYGVLGRRLECCWVLVGREKGVCGLESGFGLEGVRGLCGGSAGVVKVSGGNGSCGLVLKCAVNPLQFW
jgi:hypothetical protein